MKRNTLLQVLLVAGGMSAAAQINSSSNAGYLTRAEAMLDDCNYIGCLDQIAALDDAALTPGEREQVMWLKARAQVSVNRGRAVEALRAYLYDYAASVHRNEARMLLGDCLLEADPAAALREYILVERDALNAGQRAALDYHRAYANMRLGELEQAEKSFELSARSPEWRALSEFYIGYIAYTRKDYGKAKNLLERADSREQPGSMADYYLSQIYYVEGDYAKALSAARALLNRGGAEAQYTAEANRIAGESLFQQGNDSEAIPYLRTYAELAARPERSTLYILGTTEFKQGDYGRAVEYLEPVTDTSAGMPDAMAQSAYLFVGQALMERNDLDAALLAFDKALKMDFDRDVQEAAFYNYAVAKFGGARAPFGSSVGTFEEFLRRYPTGRYAPAVQEYLVAGYLTDQNYEAALASINRMKNPGDKVLAAKQQVLYALGTRALASGNVQDALAHLREADGLGRYDSATASRVALSLGEALYRSGDNNGAVEQFNKYLNNAPANDVNIPLARYDLGYARFALKDYKNAAVNFRKIVDNPGRLGSEVVVDALNRLGDTKYYTNDFKGALAEYKKAYDMNPAAGDYPLFQQAVIEGYQRNNKAKIATVNRLLGEFPTSSLIPDALLEMTEGYIQLGNNQAAIDTYKRLVTDYPTTEQGRRGYLQMALTQLNTGNRKDALDSYKEVVKRYPTSDEARMAIDELKRLSADDGTLGQLGNWLASVKNAPQLDVAETDVLTFNAAEKAWMTQGTTSRLERYLIDFPNGSQRAVALGYMMEDADKNGRTGDALTFASEIVEKYPDSRLAENALAVKASAEHALGRGGDALRTWTQLESRASSPQTLNAARVGIMRVARDLGDQQRVMEAADALLASSTLGSEERTEARFSRALALDLTGKGEDARMIWKELASNTDDLYGAKSAYYLAQSYFDDKQTAEAHKQADALIDSATPHTYWLARGFILLSDIYAAEGKTFEAREYLKSLKENYPGSETDIFQMIESRLAK